MRVEAVTKGMQRMAQKVAYAEYLRARWLQSWVLQWRRHVLIFVQYRDIMHARYGAALLFQRVLCLQRMAELRPLLYSWRVSAHDRRRLAKQVYRKVAKRHAILSKVRALSALEMFVGAVGRWATTAARDALKLWQRVRRKRWASRLRSLALLLCHRMLITRGWRRWLAMHVYHQALLKARLLRHAFAIWSDKPHPQGRSESESGTTSSVSFSIPSGETPRGRITVLRGVAAQLQFEQSTNHRTFESWRALCSVSPSQVQS